MAVFPWRLSTLRNAYSVVMPGLVPGIHVLATKKDVDGRDKPGHDGIRLSAGENYSSLSA
jgi:hypothetical protein